MNTAWYLLFDGVYIEGAANNSPKFMGRTTDKETAKEHYIRVARNSMSTGYVIMITDDKYKAVDYIDFDLPSSVVAVAF